MIKQVRAILGNMKKYLVRFGLLSLFLALRPAGASETFYVSPRGNDENSGSRAKPFRTLQKALSITRNTADHDERIVLSGGEYFDVAVTLEPEHSGLIIEAAPGEKPILYGGVPLKNWENEGNNFYSAALPPRTVPDAKWEVRMLQVNNQMAPRARYPAQGTLTHLNTFDVKWMTSAGGGWQRKPTMEELTTLKYKPEDLGAWLQPQNAEITVLHMWDESVVGVSANDTQKQTLTFSAPTGHPPGAFGVQKYIVWNIREGMTAPGQWFHDRVRNRVVLWPLPGQNPNRSEVIVPTTPTILHVRGTEKTPVKDISIRGLNFSVTTVPLITAGFAASAFEGAISLSHAQNCTMNGLTISRVAGHAINTRQGCVGTRVENSEITNCGAGGVYVGGSDAVIRNNHVHDIGLAYPSAIGIYRGGKNNLVAHNEVHGCSYSAINYGGTGNIVENNLIYDCMKTLHDGAAIYMFRAKNCIVRGNFARDIIDTGGYGASAYYLDEESEGCIVENNLSLRVARPSHNHLAKKNTIRNNVFITEGDAQMTFPRSSDFTLEKNVVYATGTITIENPEAITNWSKNLFFSGVKAIRKAWAKPELNASIGDTTVADPLFVDWQHGDFRYRPESPAHALGITPVDISRAGRIEAPKP